MLSANPPPAPQSSANEVPREDTNGIVQPIFALYDSIWASGMFDTVAQLTPRSASAANALGGTLLVKLVQPGQKSSGPLSMNWYTASSPRPSNRSSMVRLPAGESNT